jgi:hypothetical protein
LTSAMVLTLRVPFLGPDTWGVKVEKLDELAQCGLAVALRCSAVKELRCSYARQRHQGRGPPLCRVASLGPAARARGDVDITAAISERLMTGQARSVRQLAEVVRVNRNDEYGLGANGSLD